MKHSNLLVFVVTILSSGAIAQVSDLGASCDASELQHCVHQTPRTQIGLPRSREELDAHCLAYDTGMKCMDTWMKRCLPTDGQKLVQQQIGGARALMRFLCTNDTALRKEFLREPTCWSIVSADWSSCVDRLQTTVRDVVERSHLLAYYNKNSELCCARDDFMSCVVEAGRACSPAAGSLLKRMAWVLAQDVAACTQVPKVYCSAPDLSSSFLLLIITGVMLLRNFK